jgi:hypothetical protein
MSGLVLPDGRQQVPAWQADINLGRTDDKGNPAVTHVVLPTTVTNTVEMQLDTIAKVLCDLLQEIVITRSVLMGMMQGQAPQQRPVPFAPQGSTTKVNRQPGG